MPQTHLSDIRFDSFDLDQRILDGISEAGFTLCTPIQAQTLPLALAGRDVAGQAQTGTGKTAAFLVAAMQRLLTHPPPCEQVPESAPESAPDSAPESVQEPASQPELELTPAPVLPNSIAHPDRERPTEPPSSLQSKPSRPRSRPRTSQPRVVILAPTRELAVQIHRDAVSIGRYAGFRLGLVYGGTGYQQQRDQVAAGVDILIGTPGRLIDYFKQRVFDFKSIEVVVLDEADRMFDLGFIKDIRFVLRRMPPPAERLGMLFSATLSYRVTELAYEHMNQPRMVKIAPEKVTADRVRQSCYMVANDEKVRLLIGLIRGFADARIMIFINTKREGEWVWGFLEGNGLKSAMLSGDVPQKKRLSLLRQFQAGELPIMVATDVAARGLHITGVTHVINYDLPEDAEDYVHRIGRTARAGEAGDAISFVCETYAFCLPDIERYIGSKIDVSPVSESMLADIDYRSRVHVPRRPREDRGVRSGSRPGSRTGPGPGSRSQRRGRPDKHSQGGEASRGQRGADDPAQADGRQRVEAATAADGSRQASQSPRQNANDQASANQPAQRKPRRRRRRKPAADGAPTG